MKPSGRHDNKPLLVKHEGKPYIRSTNFADVFDRRHKHVLRDIKKILGDKTKNDIFGLISYAGEGI